MYVKSLLVTVILVSRGPYLFYCLTLALEWQLRALPFQVDYHPGDMNQSPHSIANILVGNKLANARNVYHVIKIYLPGLGHSYNQTKNGLHTAALFRLALEETEQK